MTLDEPYFLTEALFAPASRLTDLKRATLHVITVRPDGWSPGSHSAGSQSLDSEDPSRPLGVTQQSCTHSAETHSNSDTSGDTVGPAGVDEKVDSNLENSEPVNRKRCLSSEEVQDNSSADDVKQTRGDPKPAGSKLRKGEGEGIACSGAADRNKTQPSEAADRNKTQPCGAAASAVSPSPSPAAGGRSPPEQRWVATLAERLQGRPYLLDIDLDFYSTKDPFRIQCSPGETALLQQLFGFTLPADTSEQVRSVRSGCPQTHRNR